MTTSSLLRKAVTAAAVSLTAGPAVAHAGHSELNLVALLSAPLAGPDHFAAFLVVSLWASLAVGSLVQVLRRRFARRPLAA